MKKLIRLILKIPFTPAVLIFCILGYTIFTIILFFEWVYESSGFNAEVTKECRDEMVYILKKWFTTI